MMLTPEVQSVIDAWNTSFSVLRIHVNTAKVINAISTSLSTLFFKENWREARSKLVRSEFLMKKKHGGKIDIFWFCDMDNFQALISGKYDNKTSKQNERNYTETEL